MGTTIANAGDTITPTQVLSYLTARRSNNVIHRILNGAIAVSTLPPQPRAGTLELFFDTEAGAAAADIFHTRSGTFALTTDDIVTGNITYVVAESGDIKRELDPQTRTRWIVTVNYQEVTP